MYWTNKNMWPGGIENPDSTEGLIYMEEAEDKYHDRVLSDGTILRQVSEAEKEKKRVSLFG